MKKEGSGSRNILIFVFFALMLKPPLSSQALATEKLAGSIKDGRKEWRVGFSSLERIGLSLENYYMSDSVPLLVHGRLRAIGMHTLSPEQKSGYGEKLKREALVAEGKALSNLLSQRDALFFSRDPDKKRATDREQVEAKIKASRGKLDALGMMDPASLQISTEKPLVFWKDHSSGKLLSKASKDPRIYSEANDLDFLVYGTVEEIQDFLYFSIKAYDRATGETSFSYESAAAKDDIASIVDEASKALASILIGGPWSSMTIRAEPAEATISLGGQVMGKGRVEIPYIDPGEKILTISADGYEKKRVSVDLEPDTSPEFSAKLIPSGKGSISIRSNPQGADVYIDSLWQGKTPVEVPRASRTRSCTIKMDGYVESSFLLDEGGPEEKSISLIALNEGGKLSFEDAKDDFYEYFGYLMIAFPVTVFTYGIFSMYYTNKDKVYSGYPVSYTSVDWQNASVMLDVPMYISGGVTAVSAGFSCWFLYETVMKFLAYLEASGE